MTVKTKKAMELESDGNTNNKSRTWNGTISKKFLNLIEELIIGGRAETIKTTA